MNDPRSLNDPSNGVPPALLPHVHLVSTYPFPSMANVNLDTIVEALLQAPKIAKEVAPMGWQFLDAPRDGTVMLVWQPLASLGNRSASDGYVWADPEQAFSQEHKGYIIEMYVHRSGYAPGKENETAHSRRRYRLTPSPNGNPNQLPCDPALWLLHYMPSEPNYRFPANRVPILPAVNVTMQQRNYLQRYGQLIRKDFMLHDRSNWPLISLPTPPQQVQPVIASAYPGNVIQHLNRGQQPGYPSGVQQPGSVGPSPAKRQRQMASSQRPGNAASLSAAMAHDPVMLDEEDVSRGDLMDFLTPRDISITRYAQHHEWIEEIFSSPYATSQIVPVDLGLGRKGELETLTNGFFEAPTSKPQLIPNESKDQPVQISSLGPQRAEEFTQRATEKLNSLQAEIDRMKARHAKRMAKIGRNGPVYEADRRLKKLTMNPSDTAIESLQPGETPINDPAKGAATIATLRQFGQIDEIERFAEAKLGRKIEVIESVKCVEKGGLEEKTEAEVRQEQASFQAMQSHHATPPPAPLLANAVPSINAPTAYSSNSASNQPSSQPTPQPPISASITPPVPTPNRVQETPQPPLDDWVMVDQPPATSTPNLQPTTQSGLSNIPQPVASTPLPDFPQADLSAADNFDATPLANDDVFADINFDGMDTAGDELANFEAGNADFEEGTAGGDEGEESGEMVFATETGSAQGNMGAGDGGVGDGEAGFESAMAGGDEDGTDGDMVMEDSAFGDAFLHTEPVEGDGEGGS